MGKTCVICGAPSGMYPLCIKHLKEKADGKVVKCATCNTWHEIDKPCECNKSQANNSNTCYDNCIVCGKTNKNPLHAQCLECYYETKDFMNSINKNSSIRELRDYYYNLKDSILLMRDTEVAKKNCNKLIAIAIVNEKSNNDTSLADRAEKDVIKLLTSKKTPEKEKQYSEEIREEIKEKDEKKEKIHTSQDGHNLKSDPEVIIDDILWNACILHCYEKNIDEIREKRKKCDWFIPILNGAGIYIEYWGMTTEKYKQDRKEKEELYKKYNIPYISIEKDDPRGDTMTFKSNLIGEITDKAIQYYGIMPKWKP